MAKQFCPRAGAVICSHDCDTKIWQTTLRSDLETCQRCEHGRALMATIVIASRKRMEKREAESLPLSIEKRTGKRG